MSEPEPEFVDLRLWDQSALVLIDWLLTTDESSLPYTHHRRSKRSATSPPLLSGRADSGTPMQNFNAAQEQVSRDMADDDRRV